MEKAPQKKRNKANGEGTIYTTIKNGKKYYKGTLTIGTAKDGSLIRKSFCSYKKSEVIDRMADYRSKLNQGLIPQNDKMTVGAWYWEWLSCKKLETKEQTYFEYYHIYTKYIKNSPIEKIRLSELRPIDLQNYYARLLEEGRSPARISFINGRLKSALYGAIKRDYIIKNPCSNVTLPRQEKEHKISFFTTEEQALFLSTAVNYSFKTLFYLDFSTGLRIGELLALTWDDIDFDKNTLTVKATQIRVFEENEEGVRTWYSSVNSPKTASSLRTIPIPTTVVAELKKHKVEQSKAKLALGDVFEKNNLVFCNGLGQTLPSAVVRYQYQKILSACNLASRPFHAIRHTYATRLLENNTPIKLIQHLLGHASIRMTMDIYAHVTDDMLSIEVEKLNAMFQ